MQHDWLGIALLFALLLVMLAWGIYELLELWTGRRDGKSCCADCKRWFVRDAGKKVVVDWQLDEAWICYNCLSETDYWVDPRLPFGGIAKQMATQPRRHKPRR